MRIGVLLVFAVLVGSVTAVAEEPAKPADGWIDLMKPDVWKKRDTKWITTDEVKLHAEKNTWLAAAPKDGGKVWVNGETGRVADLITKDEFGDCEVHVEFLIAKNSNSGIKFHAVYEIQILFP